MTREEELRKHQHTMVSVGTGIILFGLWSMVKVVLYFIMNDPFKDYDLHLEGYDSPKANTTIYVIALIVAAIVVLIDLRLRWVIGHTARDYGMEKRDRMGPRFYIAFLITLLIDFSEIAMEIYGYTVEGVDYLDNTVTLLVDLTSFVTLLELILAFFWINEIRQEQAKQGGRLNAA